jgi:hypothetical protein
VNEHITCKECNGNGFTLLISFDNTTTVPTVHNRKLYCRRCDGKGYIELPEGGSTLHRLIRRVNEPDKVRHVFPDDFEEWLLEQIDDAEAAIQTLVDFSYYKVALQVLQETIEKYRSTGIYLTLKDGSEWQLESAITSRRLMLETKGEAVDVVGFGWKVEEDKP